MPRYFFDTLDFSDQDGIEFADDDVAREEAIAAAGSMLQDAGKGIWQKVPWKMEVRDEGGFIIGTLAFSASWKPA